MTALVDIHGRCDPRFAAVAQVFEENFRLRDEVGAAVAVTWHNEPVVDLWAGHADQGRSAPWQRDTLVNVYSTTKGITAICAHRLVDEGRLDLDAPVARYWPEFAQNGKEAIPVRWLLSHRCGLPAVRELLPGEALYDWDAMTAALAAEPPWWTPGEKHGYEAITFGWLVGEVVRRIAGKSLGAYLRDEIAAPLGLDFHVGLPDAEHGRVAEMSLLPPAPPGEEGLELAEIIVGDPEGMSARAFINPPSMALGVNYAEFRRAELPGVNGHGTARALARLYGALAAGGEVDGVRVLSRQAIERCRSEQSRGPDAVLLIETRFGLGFMLPQDRPEARFGPNPGAFGHPGAGGSLAFADPEGGIGFAYVMNRMGPHILLDPRAIALVGAVYDSM
jgi:CubicO group peptidase (beta-lactamase class C family)